MAALLYGLVLSVTDLLYAAALYDIHAVHVHVHVRTFISFGTVTCIGLQEVQVSEDWSGTFVRRMESKHHLLYIP